MPLLADNTLASLDKILNVGNKKFEQGKYESAISYYSLVISHFRGQYYAYECHLKRAEAFRFNKNYELAINDCDFILHAYNSPVSALRIKGRTLFDQERYIEAVQVFNLVLTNCYDEETLFYKEFAKELGSWSGQEPNATTATANNRISVMPNVNNRFSYAVASHLATTFPNKAGDYSPTLSPISSPVGSPNLSESTATFSDFSNTPESPDLSDTTTVATFDTNLTAQYHQHQKSPLKENWGTSLTSKISSIRSNLGLRQSKKVSFQV